MTVNTLAHNRPPAFRKEPAAFNLVTRQTPLGKLSDITLPLMHIVTS